MVAFLVQLLTTLPIPKGREVILAMKRQNDNRGCRSMVANRMHLNDEIQTSSNNRMQRTRPDAFSLHAERQLAPGR